MKNQIFRFSKALLLLLCCNTNIYAQQVPSLEWAANLGGPSNDNTYSVAVDEKGNVYSTGYFRLTADFDPGPGVYNLTAGGTTGSYVSKLDANGGFVWAKQFSTVDEVYSRGIAVDDSGNVYITGRFKGTVDLDPGSGVHSATTTGNGEFAFIVKLDTDGNFVWARAMGYAQGEFIKVSRSGEVFVSGEFSGTVDFDPVQGRIPPITVANRTSYILKLNRAGELVWVNQPYLGGVNPSREYNFDIDENANIYIAARYTTALPFNTLNGVYTVLPTNRSNVIIYKLNSEGIFQWAKQIGGNGGLSVLGLAVDKESNIYMAGAFTDTIDFNPDSANAYILTTSRTYGSLGNTYPATAGYVLKLDNIGDFVWAGHFQSSRSVSLEAIATEPLGKGIYITGYFRDTVDFDPGPGVYNLIGTGPVGIAGTKPSAFISKLNGDGSFGWAAAFHSNSTDGIPNLGLGIAYLNNYIYGCGSFVYTTDFDPDTSTHYVTTNSTSGQYDGYIVKLLDNCRYLSREFSITGEELVCPTGRYTYTVDTVPGATYSWTLPEGWIGNSSGPAIDVINSGTGIISVQINTQCDSTVQYFTTVLAIDEPVVTVDSFNLSTASSNYDTWQWYRNGIIIPNAGNSRYTVTENGEYCVVITKDDCTDTACYTVNNVPPTSSIDDPNKGSSIRIYPNPTADIIHIKSHVPVNIAMAAIDGRLLMEQNNVKAISMKHLSQGVYFLRVWNNEGHLLKVEKLVKQ